MKLFDALRSLPGDDYLSENLVHRTQTQSLKKGTKVEIHTHTPQYVWVCGPHKQTSLELQI